MRHLLWLFLLVLFALPVLAQPSSRQFSYVSSDPAGSCTNGTANRYNWTNNKEWGCENSVWTQVNSGGGGASPAGSPSAPQCNGGGSPAVLATCVSAYPTVTDASPIAWALTANNSTNGIVTLAHTTATRALNLTNLTNGMFYVLVIKQDSTGGAAMTLGSGCTWKVANGGGGGINLTQTASAIDMLIFTYDGTNCYANLVSNLS